jgi:hypothetical protein
MRRRAAAARGVQSADDDALPALIPALPKTACAVRRATHAACAALATGAFDPSHLVWAAAYRGRTPVLGFLPPFCL